MSLPRPTMTATIGGVITNRVEVAPIKRAPKTPRVSKGRYHADPDVAGVTVRCFSAPEELWRSVEEAAQRMRISRSEFLRRGVKLMLEHLAERSDRTARGCGAGTASCTSRSAPSTTVPRSKR